MLKDFFLPLCFLRVKQELLFSPLFLLLVIILSGSILKIQGRAITLEYGKPHTQTISYMKITSVAHMRVFTERFVQRCVLLTD